MRALIVGAGVVGKATRMVLERDGWECRFHDIDHWRSEVSLSYAAVRSADYAFLCIYAGGHVSKDSAICIELARELKRLSDGSLVVVQRTTCVPGTADKAAEASGLGCDYLVWPEFLRETHWKDDAMFPARSVLGYDVSFAPGALQNVLPAPVHFMDRKQAELVKLLSNAMLALRISAWNCVKEVVDKSVFEAVVVDPRLDSFRVKYGEPYGGKCLPKDLEALLDWLHAEGVEAEVLEAVQVVNRRIGE